MTSSEPVLIIGGGIGGLACALALARRGIDTHILERRVRFSEAGAGIQLGPNATRVLSQLGAAEYLAQYAGEPESIVVHDASSPSVLARLPLGSWITERHGAPYWVAHRRDLQAALLAAVADEPRVTVTTDFAVGALSDDGAGVRATSAGGISVSGRAAILADGIHSRLRNVVAPQARLFPAGYSAARAVLSAEAMSDEPDRLATCVWMAPEAHVVHYPVRAGREIAIVVIFASSEASEDWASVCEWPFVDARIAGFPAPLRARLARAVDWRRWDLAASTGIDRLHRGRIALLGDAAHPILPFLAQGGGLAIEDAATIAACLAGSAHDPATAFALYDSLRRTRVDRVVAASRDNGRIYHMSGLARAARNGVLRVASGERLMARYDWLYAWTPPA